MTIFAKNRPAVPAVWRDVDATTEPGLDASTAARHHWHCRKLLRALSRMDDLRVFSEKPSRVRDVAEAAHRRYAKWTEVERHATAASQSGPIGDAHNAVLALAGAVGVPGMGQSSDDSESWEPCDVPSESELIAMAEACVREHGAHWDQLTPKQQKVVQLLHEHGCPMSHQALANAGLNWSKRFHEEVQAPLEQLGIITVDHEHRPVLHSLRGLPLGFSR